MNISPLALGLSAPARVCGGLHFPTSLAQDESGTVYIAESGLPIADAPAGGRLVQLGPDGQREILLEGLRPPLNGVTFHRGALWLAEGGAPGRLSRYDLASGEHSVVLDGLPGGGNYHTNDIAFGPDGKLYFGQGAATNSGIVGPDSLDLAWLRQLPHPTDIPGYDVVLSGADVNVALDSSSATTGAFQAFGVGTQAGQSIPGQLPCTSAVMRCNPDGSQLELVAWGLRNPYGLRFLQNGELIAVNLGANERGSRPVGHGLDCLYSVEPGRWYGWPDFVAGQPVTAPELTPVHGAPPRFLLSNHAELGSVAQPLLRFPEHAAPTAMIEDPNTGDWWIALFGDKLPLTGPTGPRAGRCIARYQPHSRELETLSLPQWTRPIDVTLLPGGKGLLVLDFGQFEMEPGGDVQATAGSGNLWHLPLL